MTKVLKHPSIVNKLETVSLDLKMYMNIFSINDEDVENSEVFSEEELNELRDIRKRLKILANKIKQK